MKILPSQIVLIAVILVFALYVFRLRTVLIDRMIYLVLTLGGIVLVLFPELSTAIAQSIGIGRGADLLLYVFILFALFNFLAISSAIKTHERKLTTLVRELAIQSAQHGEPADAKADNNVQ